MDQKENINNDKNANYCYDDEGNCFYFKEGGVLFILAEEGLQLFSFGTAEGGEP